MKTYSRILMGVVLVLLGASCSDIQPDSEMEAVDGVRFTAKIRSAANTKAVSENGSSIAAEWKKDEQVALVYEVGGTPYKTTATVTSVDGSKNATISATLQSGVTDGTSVTLIYPASAADGTTGKILSTILTEQDGTLSAARDVRKGTATLAVEGNTASFSSNPTLNAEYAICKFSVQDLGGDPLSISTLIVKDGWNELITTVTPASATGTLYVSLPAQPGVITWFFADAEGQPYMAKGTNSLEAGRFYTPTMRMATVGNVIATDGKFYVNATAANNAGNSSSAMIAYIGKQDNICNHGLAVSLADEYDYQTEYAGANTGVSQISLDSPITGGAWRLPTVTDWQYMVSGNNTATYFANISAFQTALTSAGGTALVSGYYWTGTEDGDRAYVFYYAGEDASVNSTAPKEGFYGHVRPCLPF